MNKEQLSINKGGRTIIKGGILRISNQFLREIFADFLTGKKRLINKNLKLMGITRLKEKVGIYDVFLPHNYDLAFTADDLPVIPEGCIPDFFLKIEKVEGRKTCYKLIR